MSEILKSILTGALAIVITLTVQNLFMKPEIDHGTEYYKSEFERIDREIDQNRKTFKEAINQVKTRDERIKKDSIIIINSDRAYRDSLRRILNPPTSSR